MRQTGGFDFNLYDAVFAQMPRLSLLAQTLFATRSDGQLRYRTWVPCGVREGPSLGAGSGSLAPDW